MSARLGAGIKCNREAVRLRMGDGANERVGVWAYGGDGRGGTHDWWGEAPERTQVRNKANRFRMDCHA